VVNLWVYDVAQTDEAVFRKLSKFLNVDTHLVNFLLKAPGGMASSRLRVGNISSRVVSCHWVLVTGGAPLLGRPHCSCSNLVCVQLGSYFWSEEFLGLTAEELIFIKPSSRLGAAKRLRLPLQSIVAVQSVNPADFPFMLIGRWAHVVWCR
jgi:hypothetical protein